MDISAPGDVVRFTPQGTLRANNSLALHQAVLQGTGICQLPQFIAAPDIRAGRLIPLLPEYLLPRHHIYAVYPDREYLPKKSPHFYIFCRIRWVRKGAIRKNMNRIYPFLRQRNKNRIHWVRQSACCLYHLF